MKRFANADPARQPPAHGVSGERGVPAIARALSVQAKLSNLLSMGLMLTIGAGLLLWYYTHQLTRQARVRQSEQVSAARLAGTEMALPPLGPIGPPAGIGQQGARAERTGPAIVPPLVLMPAPAPMALPAAKSAVPGVAYRATSADDPSSATSSPQPTALERRLSGEVLVTVPAAVTATVAANGAAAETAPGVADTTAAGASPVLVVPAVGADAASAPRQPASAAAVSAPDELRSLLSSQTPPAVSAHLLPSQSLLLPKGAFIDCTLETAIDSTLPGMTTCTTATDTFGADGRVVLLERGTKLVGETRGQVQQGAARVFVLWSEARTPTGVVVPLDSPGADELGRSGLPGAVERHFWQRFGAAILVSTIDGAVQAAVQSSSAGNGTVIYNPGASQDVMTEVLKDTVAIPPTVIKHNGDRIQVLVARDVDFSSVYELRHVGHAQ